jgi:ATP-dependent DNA helicase RecG
MSMLPERESLTVEFKSDRDRLPDRELVAAVVCLANSEGGELYLGVEDDGSPTGLHAAHQNLTTLGAFIANRTNPPLSVRVEAVKIGGQRVAKICVPKSRHLVATSEGILQRRRLMADGTPECVPFYPHEFAQRQSQLGLLDYSALPVAEASMDDLDPLERVRLRQLIERYGGDRSLLPLADEELDGALGLTYSESGRRIPTVTGLLILGYEAALRRFLPTHEVAFQVLERNQVRTNDFYRWPLLRTFERVMEQFEVRVEEDEIQVGLFRVPIPTYERRAVREALVNAIVHRDYTRLGAVHLRMEDNELIISNPGGFVEGVSLDNLLVVQPKPRNPLLADAIKRIGLAERTGRGVDLIYAGLLRYGRPAPDYRQSDASTVVVRLSSAEADVAFLRLILEEEKRLGAPIPFDALVILSYLRTQRRVDAAELAPLVQKDEQAIRMALEPLVESGLVEAHGIKKGRTYMLSAKVYRRLGQSSHYVRQAGFDAIQQEQMIKTYVAKHGKIRRQDVVELCQIGPYQATRLLRGLVEKQILRKVGERKQTVYERGPNL